MAWTTRILMAGAAAALGSCEGCGPGPDAPPRATEAAVLALLEGADASPDARAELLEVGRESFAEMQCGQCHRFDGSPATGPRLDGLAGSVVRVADAAAPGGVREVTADRSWLWESIVHSQAAHVKGYENQTRMSRYAHVLDPDEVAGMILWIESR